MTVLNCILKSKKHNLNKLIYCITSFLIFDKRLCKTPSIEWLSVLFFYLVMVHLVCMTFLMPSISTCIAQILNLKITWCISFLIFFWTNGVFNNVFHFAITIATGVFTKKIKLIKFSDMFNSLNLNHFQNGFSQNHFSKN